MPPAPLGSFALTHRMLAVSIVAAKVLSLGLDSGTDVEEEVIGQVRVYTVPQEPQLKVLKSYNCCFLCKGSVSFSKLGAGATDAVYALWCKMRQKHASIRRNTMTQGRGV